MLVEVLFWGVERLDVGCDARLMSGNTVALYVIISKYVPRRTEGCRDLAEALAAWVGGVGVLYGVALPRWSLLSESVNAALAPKSFEVLE